MRASVWQGLRRNVRFYVLAASLLLSLVIFIWIKTSISDATLATIRLTQIYGFLSIIYLYITLLASPLTQAFKFLPYRGPFIKARRAIGVSAFYFAWLHTLIAFFGQLQGFSGLSFLSPNYLLALALGLAGLVILTLMAATAFDRVIERLTFPRWKWLHRLVYGAAILTLIHILMLGTHFSDLSAVIPKITFVMLVALLGLEALRMDKYLQAKFPNRSVSGLATVITCGVIAGLGYFVGLGSGGSSRASLGIHAQHLQLAQQAQSNLTGTSPGLTGDRTKRYTVSFNHEPNVSPGTNTALNFQVFDASSGNPVAGYTKLYDKFSHLVIVDNELSYYSHIHPDLSANNFATTTNFPHAGRYHLYLNYQPLGAIEQQVGFTLEVGGSAGVTAAVWPIDQKLAKTFGAYQISLGGNTYNAVSLSLGRQKLTFNIKDAAGRPVTTLKPYLAAFGHLVMINQQTYDYIHVHPATLQPPAPNANGGPQVEFLPLGLYGPIKPGIYRVFAQFNPSGELILADFTVRVE